MRTRHRRGDGSPRFTNRLVLERSTYLRQHAHNPVDWYAWGDEAFARAKAEGKLVLLSVGYATCHWCHVMEEESFEDEAIATRMNTDYVAIKVDREERPDVDGTYLRAVELLTGNAGWPMTVWMTADREVVFAGTYFPPRDGMRGARRGLLSLLESFAAKARHDPAGLVNDGRALAARLRATGEVTPSQSVPGKAVLDVAFRRFAAAFDPGHGGFGTAPKFPMPSVLDFLLRYHRRTRLPAALDMVERTLAAMAAGGVHDQIGGGFHRYATDAAWGIPHFEKMLYDNAQLANVYLAAWQVTGREEWREVTRGILDDVIRTFRAPEGGFYSAIDADDPVGEGAFYTWTGPEIDAVLDDESARAVRSRWGVASPGDLEGRSVLRIARTWAEVAGGIDGDEARARALVAGARDRMLAARADRPRPIADVKILAGWNGLAIGAFARAGVALGEPRYIAIARDAATFVVDRMTTERGLARMYARGGVGSQAGFLEDHTFLIAGLLDLFEATSEVRWLEAALHLQSVVDREFWDGDAGGYFESGQVHDARLLRTKPWDDGALPSGNALAVEDLVRLAVFRDDERWRHRAGVCLAAVGGTLAANPTTAPRMLGALESFLDRMWEVVVVSPAGRSVEGRVLSEVVQGAYLPNRAFVSVVEGDDLEVLRGAVSFIGEKVAIAGSPTAYVCERGRCLAPTSDPETLRHQLEIVLPLSAGSAIHD